MASFDLSAADFLARKLYAKGLDEKALVDKNALLKWVKKNEKFASNKGLEIAAPYVNAQGIASTHATAAANAQPGKGVSFTVPQRKIVGRYDVDGDVVHNAESGGDEAQFVQMFRHEIDGSTEMFGQELNQRLYGARLGGRALVHASTAPSTTTLTLANPSDAQFFEPQMYVSAVETATGNLRNAGAKVLLTAVDPVAGTLTASTNWTTTIAALAVGDTLIRADTHNASIDGLDGWVPVTPSTSFLGVNQTIYRTRLAGVYRDVSDSSIRAAFIKGMAFAQQQIGNKFDSKSPFFMNPADVANIMLSVEASKVVDIKLDTEYNVGLEAVQIMGCTITTDRHCPIGVTYMIPKGALTLGSAGAPAQIEDLDGKRFFHDRDTGTLKYAIYFLGNAYSEAVSEILRLKLPAIT